MQLDNKNFVIYKIKISEKSVYIYIQIDRYINTYVKFTPDVGL